MREFDPNAAATVDSGLFGLPFTPEEAALVLIPVPWEATASYGGGTARGPAAILEASRQVDLYDVEAGKSYEAGIAMLPEPDEIRAWNDEARPLARRVIDAAAGFPSEEGDDPGEALRRVNRLSALLNDRVESLAAEWLEAGKVVGLVGGDHSSPLGAIRACARARGPFGILHLDAHADLRRAYEGFDYSHASIMDNVLREVPGVTRLVQVAVRDLCEEEHNRARTQRDRVQTFFDATLAESRFGGTPWARLSQDIVMSLPQQVWLSFDIDGLDPALCPGTGTPVPGGLSYQEACYLIRNVARSGRQILGFDLCEVAPRVGDEWDANVGARLLYKMCLWTLLSRR